MKQSHCKAEGNVTEKEATTLEMINVPLMSHFEEQQSKQFEPIQSHEDFGKEMNASSIELISQQNQSAYNIDIPGKRTRL